MKCPKCGENIKYTDQFCGNCGAEINFFSCPNCGEKCKRGLRYCRNCGFDLETETEDLPEDDRQESQIEESGEQESVGESKVRRKWLLPVIILAACAVAVVLIIVFITHRNAQGDLPEDLSAEEMLTESAEMDTAAEDDAAGTDDTSEDGGGAGGANTAGRSAPDNISFEHVRGDSNEYAVITATDANGKELWEYTTAEYPMAELDRVCEIGTHGDVYYLIEDGAVVALDASNGTVLWKNEDFGGSPVDDSWAFGDDGLYLCGFYGPMIYGVSYDGTTLGRIQAVDDFEELTQVNLWPYKIELEDGAALIYYGDGSENVSDPTVLRVDLDTWDYGLPDQAGASEASAQRFDMSHIEKVSASSYLYESQYNIGHDPACLLDGAADTAWCEDVSGQGEGECVFFNFDGVCSLDGMKIYNGYQKSEDLYYKNSRPKDIYLSFSDDTGIAIELSDTMGEQDINFDRVVNTTFVTLIIKSVYPGTKYEDTLISEISFY